VLSWRNTGLRLTMQGSIRRTERTQELHHNSMEPASVSDWPIIVICSGQPVRSFLCSTPARLAPESS
jgi:hypothetical protein